MVRRSLWLAGSLWLRMRVGELAVWELSWMFGFKFPDFGEEVGFWRGGGAEWFVEPRWGTRNRLRGRGFGGGPGGVLVEEKPWGRGPFGGNLANGRGFRTCGLQDFLMGG
ncbi:hypothetical protein HNY73_011642 [Argiope bruennichi]|uniref:Secreted protein n=1 Tax=Argiope bruennichi TaxID=94029 RepID=A0A8T0F3Z4_ARGBR|nr:hypothetical protein HNY73_011642 [Argiope bruennichi]